MRDLAVLVITVACSLIALWNPGFGLLSYVLYAVLSPQSYTWAVKDSIALSKLLAISTIVGYMFSAQKNKLPAQRESILLLILWAIFGLSTLSAIYPEDAIGEFIVISKILLMALLSTVLINSEHRIHILLKVIALGVGVLAVKAGLFVLMTGARSAVFGPDNTYLTANNTLGMAVAMNVPLLFYLSKMESRGWLRWIMRGMLVLSYPAVVGTFARGDWLGLAAITGMLILKSKYKLLTVPLMAGAAILVAVLLPQIASEELTQRYEKLENYEADNSAQMRFYTWEFCARVGLARPLLGGGFKLYSSEMYNEYLPEFQERWPGKVSTCHNTWIQILAEHGLIAFVLWIGLFLSSVMSLRQIRGFGNCHGDMAWVTVYADMVEVALSGFMIMGIFVDFAYYEVYYQLLATIIILKERIRHAVAQTSATRSYARVAEPSVRPV
jgi:probable O-glycosylation ligase (exosortase A-associated)